MAALRRLADGANLFIQNAGLVRAPSPAAFMAANRDGVLNAAAAAREAAADDAAFVLVSSLAASRPEVSPYGASKAAGEAAARQAGRVPPALRRRSHRARA